MNRNILLVEPGFKTKFPPMGLMKISTYHKTLGDNVRFVKGISHDIPYEQFWDRIYISTLFTYNWDVTVKTIKYYKRLVNDDSSRIIVGGVMATLMPEELWNETGVIPIKGLLNEPGIFDTNNKIVINNLIPDYSLFDSIPDTYSLINDSYFGYSTRGCIRKCKFCGVPKLEPDFIEYYDIKSYVNDIKNAFGDKVHLVLFDNNILASKKFDRIMHDIIELGFQKGAKFTYKNKAGQNVKRGRFVDFNQGTDARLMTQKKIELLSKIAINPLRVAFDHIKDKDIYIKKIRLASKYDIRQLSNYVLYNYQDTPAELWERLHINIKLNKELNLQIYSFPMKYIPIYSKDRNFINTPNWNWQYIRGVQRILNVLKGSVMTKENFFYRAFGENPKEFIKILHMPEKILMHRGATPGTAEREWGAKYDNLSALEKKEFLNLLCENRTKDRLSNAYISTPNGKVKNILSYYIEDTKTKSRTISLFEETP